jgi:hypothetical protein
MADVEEIKSKVLQILEEHREDHPQGFNETEIMQYDPMLSLLGLRNAVEQLVAEGKAAKVTADVGQWRIALPDADIEDVPVGHQGPGAAPSDLPAGGVPLTNEANTMPTPPRSEMA